MTRTASEIPPVDRKRFGRLGGFLVIVGSLAAAPAAAFLDPAPAPVEYLIALAGVLAGIGIILIPWERFNERALYAIPVVATLYVGMSVIVYSDDFAFYMVLIAVYTAYVVRDRQDFFLLMGLFSVGVVAPTAIADQSFDEFAHQVLVTLPVMIVSAAVVRYLRDALEARERQYRRFAFEAVSLAERIRGGQVPAKAPTPDDVEERLAELATSRSER
jgi:hypothetical protein